MKSELLKFKSYEINKTQLINLQGQGLQCDSYECCVDSCYDECASYETDPEYSFCLDNCTIFC